MVQNVRKDSYSKPFERKLIHSKLGTHLFIGCPHPGATGMELAEILAHMALIASNVPVNAKIFWVAWIIGIKRQLPAG